MSENNGAVDAFFISSPLQTLFSPFLIRRACKPLPLPHCTCPQRKLRKNSQDQGNNDHFDRKNRTTHRQRNFLRGDMGCKGPQKHPNIFPLRNHRRE